MPLWSSIVAIRRSFGRRRVLEKASPSHLRPLIYSSLHFNRQGDCDSLWSHVMMLLPSEGQVPVLFFVRINPLRIAPDHGGVVGVADLAACRFAHIWFLVQEAIDVAHANAFLRRAVAIVGV
eukprot:Skav223818  [mRNA]  locus=scaffold575:1018853:1022584:- [translate_table: standard]